MGLDVCALEAQDDVYDEAAGTPTNLAAMSGVNTTDEDIVTPEVTKELNRLKLLGRPYRDPDCRRADASGTRVQSENQRTAG